MAGFGILYVYTPFFFIPAQFLYAAAHTQADSIKENSLASWAVIYTGLGLSATYIPVVYLGPRI